MRDGVRFEIADLAGAVRLARRLGKTWTVVISEGQDIAVVTPVLRGVPGDLALLLREVEGWVEEESACAIRYEVDGRGYVLEAGEADWAALPRAS